MHSFEQPISLLTIVTSGPFLFWLLMLAVGSLVGLVLIRVRGLHVRPYWRERFPRLAEWLNPGGK